MVDITANLVCDALQMALFRRKHPKGIIVHSDRGSQYCSNYYRALLRDHQLICSMSAKGCCYDNACSESFFHSLKVEAIHGERFETRVQMRDSVFEYIEVNYSRQLYTIIWIAIAHMNLNNKKWLNRVSNIAVLD